MERGLVQLYTGDGKGKTTAAVGLCVRASGQHLSVALMQFLKNGRSGELQLLQRMGVHVDAPECEHFLWEMDAAQRMACQVQQRALFERAKKLAPDMDVMVLDEVVGAAGAGMVDLDALLDFIVDKPAGLELVLTGRGNLETYEPYCDYITVMQCIKHPADEGEPARTGIEF